MLLKEHITFGKLTKRKENCITKRSPQIELSNSPENFSLREQHETSPGYLLKCEQVLKKDNYNEVTSR